MCKISFQGLVSVIVLLIAIALLLYAIKTANGRLLIFHLSAQVCLFINSNGGKDDLFFFFFHINLTNNSHK